jgi:hypothetical protein
VVAAALVVAAAMVVAAMVAAFSYNASRRRRRACTLTYRNTQAYPPRSAVLDCDMCALLLRH